VLLELLYEDTRFLFQPEERPMSNLVAGVHALRHVDNMTLPGAKRRCEEVFPELGLGKYEHTFDGWKESDVAALLR
jgi:hypothetical protein